MSRPESNAAARPRRVMTLLQVLVLSALWLLFSGKLDLVHLAYGVVSVGLVMLMTRHLILAPSVAEENELVRRLHWGRVAVYPLWLLWQIVVSNLQMAAIVLRPRLDIDPVILRFEFPVDSPLAKTTLGNSITLTPGTYTLRIREREFVVHSINRPLAAGLEDGSMQRMVGRAFGEDPAPPTVHFDSSFRDVDKEAD